MDWGFEKSRSEHCCCTACTASTACTACKAPTASIACTALAVNCTVHSSAVCFIQCGELCSISLKWRVETNTLAEWLLMASWCTGAYWCTAVFWCTAVWLCSGALVYWCLLVHYSVLVHCCIIVFWCTGVLVLASTGEKLQKWNQVWRLWQVEAWMPQWSEEQWRKRVNSSWACFLTSSYFRGICPLKRPISKQAWGHIY